MKKLGQRSVRERADASESGQKGGLSPTGERHSGLQATRQTPLPHQPPGFEIRFSEAQAPTAPRRDFR